MSSAKLPLQIELIPSRSLKLLLSVVHGLALLAVLFSAVEIVYQWGLIGLIVLSWSYYWIRFTSNSPWFIKRLHITPGLAWYLQTKQDDPIKARLLSYYLHPHVLVLWFAINAGKRRSVIILRDNIGKDQLRHLRAILLNDNNA